MSGDMIRVMAGMSVEPTEGGPSLRSDLSVGSAESRPFETFGDLVAQVKGLSESQMSLMRAYLELAKEREITERATQVGAPVDVLKGEDELVSLESDVSVNSSVSSARARKRVRARRRKRSLVRSDMTYTEPAGVPAVVLEQGYSVLFNLEHRERVEREIGFQPTFERFLGASASQLRSDWKDFMVSREAGIFHVAASGMVPVAMCLASVADGAGWPTGSVGERVMDLGLRVPEVLKDKAPLREDKLSGGSELDHRIRAESAFRSIVGLCGGPEVFPANTSIRFMDAGVANLLVYYRGGVPVGFLPALGSTAGEVSDAVRAALVTHPKKGLVGFRLDVNDLSDKVLFQLPSVKKPPVDVFAENQGNAWSSGTYAYVRKVISQWKDPGLRARVERVCKWDLV